MEKGEAGTGEVYVQKPETLDPERITNAIGPGKFTDGIRVFDLSRRRFRIYLILKW